MSTEWITSPEVLELLLQLRAIKIGDLVRWEVNEGNTANRGKPPQEVMVAEHWIDALYIYYCSEQGLNGKHYPNGWRLTGWRRP